MKVSSLYIAQIKEKHGIIERESYNLPKSENSRQPKCPPEKEVAIRRLLGYFHNLVFSEEAYHSQFIDPLVGQT